MLCHNFSAPELLCRNIDNDDTDDSKNSMAQTQESDVYAFGCLYYEVSYIKLYCGVLAELLARIA